VSVKLFSLAFFFFFVIATKEMATKVYLQLAGSTTLVHPLSYLLLDQCISLKKIRYKHWTENE